ncbi:MAG: hypothetical protein BJ554DRAFT_6348 [Olpidium bornovanus]|uniref:Uncharacterized protein n=1 Tax=Olpidium bornovanus TaxID=278681 RepID=A0A8H8DK97_9FUNG|nr:MAG: hypothetical protein BJ554DRAFT_6348 [Olpidium bornovanus]
MVSPPSSSPFPLANVLTRAVPPALASLYLFLFFFSLPGPTVSRAPWRRHVGFPAAVAAARPVGSGPVSAPAGAEPPAGRRASAFAGAALLAVPAAAAPPPPPPPPPAPPPGPGSRAVLGAGRGEGDEPAAAAAGAARDRLPPRPALELAGRLPAAAAAAAAAAPAGPAGLRAASRPAARRQVRARRLLGPHAQPAGRRRRRSLAPSSQRERRVGIPRPGQGPVSGPARRL